MSLLTEWDEDEARAYYREEGRAEGREESRAQAREEANTRVASDMLRNGEPIDKVKLYSRLSEEAILNLAESLGIDAL